MIGSFLLPRFWAGIGKFAWTIRWMTNPPRPLEQDLQSLKNQWGRAVTLAAGDTSQPKLGTSRSQILHPTTKRH